MSTKNHPVKKFKQTKMTTHNYSTKFYDFVEQSSGRSASTFISKLNLGYEINSILDVGCGLGVWLKAWKEQGVPNVFGIDGDYVNKEALHIPLDNFYALDLSQPFDLQQRFDLVECLEVAEHIPEASAAKLVASLTKHGDIIIFSAATPGQGGEHHVNEQPLEYWASHFANLGYQAFDYPRRQTKGILKIEPWYRYNTIIYANSTGAAKMSPEVLSSAHSAGVKFKDFSSAYWKIRCSIIQLLPLKIITSLSLLKQSWTLRRLK